MAHNPADQHRPAAWPVVLVGAILCYGSAYPFHFVFPPPEAAWHHLGSLREEDLFFGDTLANFLLFVPLGFLIGIRSRSRFLGPLWGLGIGLALGLGLQLLQVFIPERVPALWDTVWNTAGAVAGTLIPLGPVRRLGTLARPQSRFAGLLMALWLAIGTFPFVPTLDWAAIKEALKPLLLDPQIPIRPLLAEILGWAAFAHLWRHVVRLPYPRAGPIVTLAMVLGAQVLVVGRSLEASDALGGSLGLALGLMALAPRRLHWGLLVGVSGWLVGTGLFPLVFRETPASFHWLPLAGFLHDSLFHGLATALEKLFWYGLLLELLIAVGLHWRSATVTGMALLGTVEWAQRWLDSGHVPEITDPLLIALLALLRSEWNAVEPAPRGAWAAVAGPPFAPAQQRGPDDEGSVAD